MKILLICGLLLTFVGLLNAEEPYPGYSDDRKLLRSTTVVPSGKNPELKINGSSEQAIQAAHRLFSQVSFTFKSRDEVLEILGDPATISDYGVQTEDGKGAELVYRFDSGFGGWQYTIKLESGKVWSIHVEGIN